ncbi:MAG: 3-phosphoglycerate dehydrogenase [Lachnospiraceae bacterium]|nr:3-phosphoglycerate dehydrogenase [Lachnospiraceae bacterium]
MSKIKCYNQIAQVGLAQFSADYTLTDDIAEADGVLVRSASLHEVDIPDSVLAIARAGAGVNNIPLDKCAEKGIVVFNTPGANANGVKELVICGMLLAARDVAGGIEWVHAHKGEPDIGKTMEKAKKNYAGTEIQGKKLGVIGLGAIGVLVANAASSLGMEVYGYDPFLSVNAAWLLSRKIKHVEDLGELYADCDYITVHVPLTPETKGMVGADAFSRMKDGAVLLNFSRDALVDEDVLADALAEGKLHRYVTDFPTARTSEMDGVIALPHLGASTEESEDNCAVMAVRQLRDYIENGNVVNSVNYAGVTLGPRKGERLGIFHHNVKNIIAQIAGILGAEGVNIEGMSSKGSGDLAYTLMELGHSVSEEGAAKIAAIDGVFRLRVIR